MDAVRLADRSPLGRSGTIICLPQHRSSDTFFRVSIALDWLSFNKFARARAHGYIEFCILVTQVRVQLALFVVSQKIPAELCVSEATPV